MAWSDARTSLMTALETLNYPVHVTPPQIIDDKSVHIMLVPPARTVERRASHVRRTTYEQRIMVMRHIASEGRKDIDAIAESIDDVVEEINGVLDGQLQLGGNAVSVTPPEWDEMTVVDIPSGSGLLFAQMLGSVSIEIEEITTFAP